MKLDDIYSRLSKWDATEVHLISVKESEDRIQVENVVNFKRFIEDVESIPVFSKLVGRFKRTALYLASADQITVNRQVFKKIYKLHTKLFAYMEALKKTLGHNLGQTSGSQIVVKLSDPDDLEQMLKNLKIIQAEMTPILVNDHIKGDAKIEFWNIVDGKVNIQVASHAAMQLVASISGSAVQICQKMREGRFIYEYVQELKVKDESLLDINSGHDKAVQQLVDQQTDAILKEHFSGAMTGQLSDCLKSALSRFAELIDQGTEIQPASNAPEKVRSLFPNLNDMRRTESQIKLVSNVAA